MGVKVIAMGEPMSVGPEKFIIVVNAIMPDEETAKQWIHVIGHCLHVLGIEASIGLVGAQETVQPDVPGAS
jgi:hypothetical protein